jgi:metal-dependent amidase/aminoacylase/carboxypeptidase family protein
VQNGKFTPTHGSINLLRKELHKNPEVSGKSCKPLKESFLLENKPLMKSLRNRGAGIALSTNLKKKTVLFRCELDALPIEEINSFEHRSLINGVSHKCDMMVIYDSMRSS